MPLAAEALRHHDILDPRGPRTFGRGDDELRAGHADHASRCIARGHHDCPLRVTDQQRETPALTFAVGAKIHLDREQRGEQQFERREVPGIRSADREALHR